MPTVAVCRRCGESSNVTVTRLESGPHYARLACHECGSVMFLPAPWSFERAAAFTMPYGRFRGVRLGDLTATQEGRSYLRWLKDEHGRNAGIAAGILLDQVDSTCSDASLAHEKPIDGGTPMGFSETPPPLAESRATS